MLVNDCYNANPISMRAALDHLASLERRTGAGSPSSAAWASSAPTALAITARRRPRSRARRSTRSSASASSPATTRPTTGSATRAEAVGARRRTARRRRRDAGQGLALGRPRGVHRRAAARCRRRDDRARCEIGEIASTAIDRGEVLIAGMAAMLITIFLGPKFIEFLRVRGVRPADPRGGPAGAPREGRHADDGRADPLPGDRGSVPGALRPRHRQPRRLRRRARLRRARLRRRLHQDLQAPLARLSAPLQAARPDRDRAGAVVGRLRRARPRPGARVADLRHRDLPRPGALPALHLPRRRRRLERGQPHRRPRRPRRGLLRDRPARLHGDHDHQRPGRPGAARRLLRRRLDRLPVVQRLPGLDLHGRHGLARARRRDRRASR